MPSVVGLLEQRELCARRRVDELREEADRVQTELAVAEREWEEWAIACSRVGEVLAPEDESEQDPALAEATAPAAEEQSAKTPQAPEAAKTKSQVPVWREGLTWSVLSADRQRILTALADRARLHQGALTCQEMAAAFGMDVVPARVEALRSKAERLVARGWLAEPAPGGSCRLRVWPGEPAGHEQGHRPVDHRLGAGGAALKVAGQAAGAHQVGEESLDDPPLGQDHEAAHVVAAFDDREPSPGSVYPTLQLLEDEGLIISESEGGKKLFALTEEGRAAAGEGPEVPGEEASKGVDREALNDIRRAGFGLMEAFGQVWKTGSKGQREKALAVIGDARKKLYLILADED